MNYNRSPVLCRGGTRAKLRQKMCGETFVKLVRLALEQIVGQIRPFVEWWDPEASRVLIESEDEKGR